MATVTTQERTNILKLVAGMFNAAPGATYLNEFTNAFVDLNKDLGALANALGQTGAFQSLYPSFLSAEEFANKFLDTLGLKANTEAQDWVKAKVTAGESYASVIFQALVAIDASTAAEFKAAKDQLTNKAAVAEYYSVEQNKSATDLAALQAVVAKVTNDAATVEAAKAGAAATAGQSFSLTEKIGEVVVGTAGNDTFKAVLGSTAADTTLNIGDTIDGGAGTDTLNLVLGTGAATTVPGGVEIKNVEIINLDVTAAAAGTPFLTSSLYSGVEQLWQINNGAAQASAVASGATVSVATTYSKFGDVVVADGVTAGFKGNNKTGTDSAQLIKQIFAANASTASSADAVEVKAASAAQKTISIALDGVGNDSFLKVAAAAGSSKIETVNVSGSLAKASPTTDGSLSVALEGTNTKTFNGAFTSGVKLSLSNTTAVETVDLSKSTGGVELNAAGFGKLATLKGGAGNDKLTINLADVALTVDMGAGNDVLTINDAASSADTKGGTITLGAGKDTLKVSALVNVVDTADLSKGLVTVEDFKIGEDTLQLGSTVGKVLTTAQLDTAKAADSLKAAVESLLTGDNKVADGKAAVFNWGGDAYMFVNSAVAGQAAADTFTAGDGLIKLVGVDAAALSTDQNGGLLFV